MPTRRQHRKCSSRAIHRGTRTSVAAYAKPLRRADTSRGALKNLQDTLLLALRLGTFCLLTCLTGLEGLLHEGRC